jgi:hypothetical protein
MWDINTWQRPSIFITDTPILSSERMLHNDYDRKGLVVKKKSLVMILKGFGAKTNWLAVNRQSQSNSDSVSVFKGLRQCPLLRKQDVNYSDRYPLPGTSYPLYPSTFSFSEVDLLIDPKGFWRWCIILKVRKPAILSRSTYVNTILLFTLMSLICGGGGRAPPPRGK